VGIRQSVNDHPVPAAILTVVIMLAGGYFVGLYLGFFHHSQTPLVIKCYYCDESGQNVFIDNAENVPPFDHNGKLAYRAVIFKCVDKDGNVMKAPFVQRLECYDEESRAEIIKAIKSGISPLVAEFRYDAPPPQAIGKGANPAPAAPTFNPSQQRAIENAPKRNSLMIKRPSDTKWTKITDGTAYTDIIGEQCPGGTMRPVSVEEKALGAQ
jgi:hypothetical protein